MNDDLKICTECGRGNTLEASVCYYCAHPFDTDMKCLECGNVLVNTDTVCPNCGYPVVKKNRRISNFKLILQSGKQKNLGIWLIVIAAFLVLISYLIRFQSDYDYYDALVFSYEQDIYEYRSERNSNQRLADSYSGFFESAHQDLADKWQELIEETEHKIIVYQGKMTLIIIISLILFVLAIACAGYGVFILKKAKDKNEVTINKIKHN